MTQPENLHPYDGQERTFHHHDEDPSRRARGLAVVTTVLGLPEPPSLSGLRYDLSFCSGGMGVFDWLRIAFPRTSAEVHVIVARLGLMAPESAVADEASREQFEWLVLDDDEPRPLHVAVAAFLDEHRAELLPRPDERARVWFSPDSGVNSWSVVYEHDGELCFISFDQG